MAIEIQPISDRALAFVEEKIAREDGKGSHYSYNFVLSILARLKASEGELARLGKPVSYP